MNKFIILKPPRVIRIEPSMVCNLRCRHCLTGINPVKITPNSIMKLRVFHRIVEEIRKAGTIKVAVLYHGGEPFINKNLFQMINILKWVNIKFIKIVTNGMLIQKTDVENIVDSGLSSIEFSLDGLSPKENNQIRIGSDCYKVLDIIKELIELKKEKRSNTPKIFIANTQIPKEEIIKKNIPISPPKYILDYLAKYKKEVEFKCVYMIGWPGFDIKNKYKFVKQPSSLSQANSCDHIINTITIRSNGDVVPCCYDIASQYVIGNILKSTLKDIWNNEKYLILRKSIAEKKYLSLCRNCAVVKPQLHLCKIKKYE